MERFALGMCCFALAVLAGCVSPIGTASHAARVDYDEDGFTADVDCDDRHSGVNSKAREVCNGIDDDCDGAIDGPEATGATTWYADRDGDGHGDPDAPITACAPEGHSPYGDDCNDGNADIGGGCGA